VAATEALTNAVKGAPEDHVVDVAIEGGHRAVDVEVTNVGAFGPSSGSRASSKQSAGAAFLSLALVDEVEFASVRGRTRVRLRRVSA